jgi:hypothetical protein
LGLSGCQGTSGCLPGKEGGCPATSGAVLTGAAALAALGGGSGGGAVAPPSGRQELRGAVQRGAFTVGSQEQEEGWSTRRATLLAPTAEVGRPAGDTRATGPARVCAPGQIHYHAGDARLLGCILAAPAEIAGVRVPAGQGFLCGPDEPGCVLYTAQAPGLRIGVLELPRGWGVTVVRGQAVMNLGIDPARALDLPAAERGAIQAAGIRAAGLRLLAPSVSSAIAAGTVAADPANAVATWNGQRVSVSAEGRVTPF